MLLGQKHDAVPGWIAAVPFQLIDVNLDLRTNVNVRPAQRRIRAVISDSRIGLTITNVDLIGPISVSLTAAQRHRRIRLRQGLIPLVLLWMLAIMRVSIRPCE